MTNANPYVFGYGSLLWNPGFPFLCSHKAVLHGAHRALAIYSHRHRGTPERPGLVFGLRRGGSCHGLAFEVAAEDWPEVFAYLQAREQDRGVYREAWRAVTLAGGAPVSALAFLVDERHPQYAGRLPLAEQVRIIAAGEGESGRNSDYVRNTAQHLAALGIRDRMLGTLVAALEAAEEKSLRRR